MSFGFNIDGLYESVQVVSIWVNRNGFDPWGCNKSYVSVEWRFDFISHCQVYITDSIQKVMNVECIKKPTVVIDYAGDVDWWNRK